MRIASLRGTDLFMGSASAPRQVVRVTLTEVSGPVLVRVEGPAVTTPEPVTVTRDGEAEVGVLIAAPAPEGSVHRVTAVAEGAGERRTLDGSVEAAATGWTMWMVSHFHYDPVWWNTQAGFTEVWHQLPDLPWVGKLRPPFVRTAFDLVRAHLDAARHDDDYKFVLAEIDYLKPFWDVFPEEREQLRLFLAEGRVELVGGTYNEPNTNLTHPESTIRNAVYGIGYQRDVLGGDPRTAWMLDVFGHDPAFPGLMADAGLDSASWARGPFHMVGAKRHTGDITRMQFPSEFEWVSPSGRGLLTSYMSNHYVAGWDVERKATLEEAMAEAYNQFGELKKVAATPNVLLPVGHDHNLPSRWCTEVHRAWAARYVWPRFRVGLPREFFAAVRAAAPRRGITPQTRDMNPVYTGKDVSYIDTKQAQRAAEVAVLDAERLATLAALLGERYPSEALDKAWRLLAYGAHHDAITGTESDQVYLDLLAGWREAYELGAAARDGAIECLAAHADTEGAGRAILAVNTLSWDRDGVTTVRVAFPEPGTTGAELRDDRGEPVPVVAEGVLRHPDGTVAELHLTFVARNVPSLGFRVYHLGPAPDLPAGWVEEPERATIENETFMIEADAARGGALSRILDRRTDRELLRPGGLGGELYLQDEYETHPVWHEGPWHLLPKGPGVGTREQTTTVHVRRSPVGRRIVAVTRLADLRVTQETTLWDGIGRIDFRTHVDGSIGRDHLLRARFDLDLPGALPVSEVGFAAVGRSFGFPNSDAGEHLYTLDNPAHTWAGLSATARIALSLADGRRENHAIGVAEVVAPGDGHGDGDRVRGLLDRLVACGVTATLTRPDGPRYGALDGDSNLPDVRIVIGDANANAFAEQVLSAAPEGCREALARHGRVFVPARHTRRDAWVPSADLRGVRDLPVLIVAGSTIDDVIDDLADSVIDVPVPAGLPGTAEPVDDYSVAVVNRGTPGFVAESDGTCYVSLMRSCGAWPSGVWIDGPARTVPDGSSFSLQHWTHTFEYSLVAGAGDWRAAGFVQAGQEVNHAVLARQVSASPGPLPARTSLGGVEPSSVVLTALKPRGNPMASGLSGDIDLAAGVTVRLYESAGSPAVARVRLHGGLTDVEVATLLETATPEVATRAEATLAGPDERLGDVVIPLRPAEIVTLGARAALGLGHAAAHVEPAQPVFTRYWLHNKGPAPAGYLPVAVHVHPAALHVVPGGEETVRVTVACSARSAVGLVELDVPDGWGAAPPGPLKYDLEAGEHAEFETVLRPPAAAGAGTYFVAARIRDELGQTLEDVVTVAVGDREHREPLTVTLDQSGLEIVPGGWATLTVELVNDARTEVRGEAQLLSPFGTWGAGTGEVLSGPWTQGFAVPARGRVPLRFTVRAPGDARPGAHWWAAVKVCGFGRVHYTRTLPVEVLSLSGQYL
ncbi:glycoside hydrolase family 38 N-terminal domain-containing protein [Nonomuraea helvata]|uniref:Glycoside hydrolase family 38 C-terminal domain-containing protein n=1 Tax=Nonomuraea helvata TaxID=37484 RepID=A0ABV5RVN8_9ACTN